MSDVCECGHPEKNRHGTGWGLPRRCFDCDCPAFTPTVSAAPVDDVARLRALAEAATPGPWEANALGSEGYDVRAENPDGGLRRLTIARCGRESWETDKSNAAYIAAMSPDTALRILGRLAEAERERDALRDGIRRLAALLSDDLADGGESDQWWIDAVLEASDSIRALLASTDTGGGE